MQFWSWVIDIQECLAPTPGSQSTTHHVSTGVHLQTSLLRVLLMQLASLGEEHHSCVGSWHRCALSQRPDQVLSEHNAEITADVIGCVHWGKSSKLGTEFQYCIYSSIQRSLAGIPAWFGHPALGGKVSPHGTTADSEQSPRDWILAEALTMSWSRASATFLKQEKYAAVR